MIGPVTGKTMEIEYKGRRILYHNQRSREWTHFYDYQSPPASTLSSAGCGIFSLCHAVEWMSGARVSAEEMADFSLAHGGRGDDGTDRPALLNALMETGMAKKLGFQYQGDGLRNDLDALWEHLDQERGTAFCNLRAGHIVALAAARADRGEKQLLVIDSYSESAAEKVRDHVREVIPQSLTVSRVQNTGGLAVGQTAQYGMFWVRAGLPVDFNLLYRI